MAGLPRTGSTLLTYLFAQNPDVYVSATSPVARLMLGVHQTCQGVAHEGLVRVGRSDFEDVLLREVPNLYYQEVTHPYILEKDRAWAYDPLGFLEHITPTPKVLILLRSVPDIVRSFIKVKIDNGDVLPERGMLVDGNDPFIDAYRSTLHALDSDDPRFLFTTYDQLIHDPQRVISFAYQHFGWQPYKHDFGNVLDLQLENDAAFHTEGLHTVRPQVARRHYRVRLSERLDRRSRQLDDALWDAVRISLRDTPDRHV